MRTTHCSRGSMRVRVVTDVRGEGGALYGALLGVQQTRRADCAYMRGCVFLLTWYFRTNWCTSVRSSAASAPYVGEPELRFVRLPVFPEATSALALASPSPPSLSTTVLSSSEGMLPTTTLLPSLPSPSSGGGDGESRDAWLTFPAANAFPVLSSTSMSRSSSLSWV